MASFPSEVHPSQAHPDPNTPAAVVANCAFISSIDPKASSIALASCGGASGGKSHYVVGHLESSSGP